MKNIKFINAGAGSGKTFRLTEEICTRVNPSHEYPIKGSEFMLTTFTRKAAEEIKLNSRTKLIKNRFHEAALDLQDAYMGTVHSVGYQFIKRYWHLIGMSPEIRELPKEAVEFYFNQAISSIPTKEELNRLSFLGKKFQFQTMNDAGPRSP